MKAGQFLLLLPHFDEFDPKINVLSGSDKRKENELLCVADTRAWSIRNVFFLQNSRRQMHYHSMKHFMIVCSMNIEVFVVALINDSRCFGQ